MKIVLAVLLAGWAAVGLASGEPVALGHGVNLGNMLEAPKEGQWGQHVEEGYFPTIHQAGFTLIRVPISWAAHVGPGPDFTIDPVFLARVDWVVAQAEKNHLTAILDDHNDDALMRDPDANGARFVAIWKQVAEHYQAAPPSILFELLNEPNGKLDAPHWNALLAQALAVVRATNPKRTVVIGPVRWNSIGELKNLVLPDADQNIVVTFHYYDPFHFTHQGAEWAEGSSAWLGTTWGTDSDKKQLADAFDQAAKWGADHHRPLYLGEFGAYSKSPSEGRARWTGCIVHAAESRGMAWTYWEFCSGFGVYDPVAKQWRQPLLDALLGK